MCTSQKPVVLGQVCGEQQHPENWQHEQEHAHLHEATAKALFMAESSKLLPVLSYPLKKGPTDA